MTHTVPTSPHDRDSLHECNSYLLSLCYLHNLPYWLLKTEKQLSLKFEYISFTAETDKWSCLCAPELDLTTYSRMVMTKTWIPSIRISSPYISAARALATAPVSRRLWAAMNCNPSHSMSHSESAQTHEAPLFHYNQSTQEIAEISP